MPQKRAKFSERQALRKSIGFNLAPTAQKKGKGHDIPRNAMFLFQQPPSKEAKADDAPKPTPAQLTIRPNERMRDFNQRVEKAFSSDVNASMRRGLRTESNQRKRERRRTAEKEKKRAANPYLVQAQEAAQDWKKADTKKSANTPALVAEQATRPKPKSD
ncbi:hypothetical protein MVES_001548 [Malassezia vespertilionis]|uniref:Uncharacterized protein n=1 Tax=Malassezia vespertilionis TaxID=2020962 RepID=A0A2N1JCM0_9BASI|nr:hypothetical protein MVES_001548 [Malassezia vespertilionis]